MARPTMRGLEVRLRLVRLLFAFLLLFAPDRSASADDDKVRAREEYRRGTRAYDLSQFPEALDHFEAAYKLYEEPAILYNIGQCYRQLGKKELAVQSYKSFLRKVPNAPKRPELEGLIVSLERDVAAEKEAKLEAERLAAQKAQEEEAARKAAEAPAVGGGALALGLGVGLGVGLTRSHISPTLGEFGPGSQSQGLVGR